MRWGLRPQAPVPPEAGGFAPKPPPPAAGGSAPDPQNSPPLRISGYAPDTKHTEISPLILKNWLKSLIFRKQFAKAKIT